MGCALYSGAHYTQVNMVYLHIPVTFKNCLPTPAGKKKRTMLKLSLTIFNNSKCLSSFGFYYVYNLQKRKNPCFYMTVMKTA